MYLPPSFDDKRWAPPLTLEASTSKTFTRPEQTSYPLSAAAGRNAAALWPENPIMLLAAWRDYRFSTHACGVGFNDLIKRRQTFDEAFTQGVADAIVGVVIIAVGVSHT